MSALQEACLCQIRFGSGKTFFHPCPKSFRRIRAIGRTWGKSRRAILTHLLPKAEIHSVAYILQESIVKIWLYSVSLHLKPYKEGSLHL